jgi:hypothetical protein
VALKMMESVHLHQAKARSEIGGEDEHEKISLLVKDIEKFHERVEELNFFMQHSARGPRALIAAYESGDLSFQTLPRLWRPFISVL